MNSSTHDNRRSRELEAARRISEALFQHLSVKELVEQALKIALEVVNAQEGSVLMANPETEELIFYHSVGERAPKTGTSFPWKEGIAGTVFSKGESLVIQDVKQDERHWQKIDEVTGFSTRDMIALPLKRWEGLPIGVLEIMNKRDGRLDQEDLDILTIIASFTALSIEQAQLFQEAKLADVVRVLGDIGQDVNNLLIPVTESTSILKEEFQGKLAALPPSDTGKTRPSYEMCQAMVELMANNLRLIQERIRETTDCIQGLTSPPQFSTCFFQHVVASVYDTLRRMANEKDIQLSHEGIQDLPAIQAEESRLFNAFYNLIKDAITEVSSGGRILIRGKIEEPENILRIEVQDSGRGISPDRIKDRFASPALNRGREKGMTGLATKIVQDVVDVHQGNITVESETGKGTIIHINIPMNPVP
jgi:signal transduction histidine kinase